MKGRGTLGMWGLMLLIGCSTETPVGMTPTPPDPGGPGMLPMAPVDEPFSFPAGVAGEWTGYFEGFTLPSGSDAISLRMGQNASGANEIQLVVGAGTPPPPPTDAAAYWPSRTVYTNPIEPLFEGIPYLAHQVRWDGRRLRFLVASHSPWQAWCALQTSYPRGNAMYECTPGTYECGTPAAGGPERCLGRDGSGATFSAAQAMQCQNCACDAAECIALPIPDQPFDITFDTDSAGSGVGLLGHTLRVMK